MRKLLLSLACLLSMAGVALAAEVTFLKYDAAKKELTVKDGDADKTYKVTDKTKVTVIDKDGNAKEAELKVLEKAREGKTKFELTADKDTATEIKMRKKRER
jgi:hypothetical protein